MALYIKEEVEEAEGKEGAIRLVRCAEKVYTGVLVGCNRLNDEMAMFISSRCGM